MFAGVNRTDKSSLSVFLSLGHDYRLLRRFEVEAFGPQCQNDIYAGQVPHSHCVLRTVACPIS